MTRFVTVFAVLALAGQAAIQKLEFEVATLKPWERPAPGSAIIVGGSCTGTDSKRPANPMIPVPLGRCLYTRVNAVGFISMAYPVKNDGAYPLETVFGAPSWASEESFDFQGKAENPESTTEAQLKEMLSNHMQKILTEKYKLKFHHEAKETQGFALVVGKGGFKLKESIVDQSYGLRFGGGATVATHITMAQFAAGIRGILRAPMMDKTGISGVYDFTVSWTPSDFDSVMHALEDTLGLRLESVKVTIDTIVVDEMVKPAQ